MNKNLQQYHDNLSGEDRAIADVLYKVISDNLPEAENKIWHRHPVWFLKGNPIVGYHKLKDCVRLLFWSGQSFEEEGLSPEGKFKATEVRYTDVKQIKKTHLKRWLKKSKGIQWDYKNIVKNKGKLNRLLMVEPTKRAASGKSKPVEIKTKATDSSVADFLNKVQGDTKREDSFKLLEMMKKATGEEPKLWSNSTIGFGKLIYKSPRTGREVEWFKIGFAPRKANLSLHLAVDINKHADALEKLGKYKTGAGCLYINKLADVDMKVLKSMIDKAAKKK